LSVSRTTAYKLIAQGKLRTVELPGITDKRVLRSEVDRLIGEARRAS
jgi:excisionase family DNA binding protein